MLLVFSASLALSLLRQAPDSGALKKPLDHSVYDGWKSIRGAQFSDDGKWFTYTVAPQEGDGTLYVVSTATPTTPTYTIPRGSVAHFTHDSRFLIVTQVPVFAEAKKARIAKAKPDDQPKNALIVIDLTTGQRFDRDRVAAVKYAEDDTTWLLYRRDLPAPVLAKMPASAAPAVPALPAKAPDEETGDDQDQRGARGGRAAGAATDGAAADVNTVKPGETWILRNLVSGKEDSITEVSDAVISKKEAILAYAIASKDAKNDLLIVRDLKTGKETTVVTGEAHYKDLTLSEDGSELAFVTDKDDFKAKPVLQSVYSASTSNGKPELRAKLGTAGIPKDWSPSDAGLSFSEDGRRLFFRTAPKPEVEKKNDVPEEDRAVLDVWNYMDDVLQTQQLVDLAADKSRNYQAVCDLRSGKVVQLATPLIRSMLIPDKGRAGATLAETDVPYLREASWDPDYADLYRVDTNTGQAQKLITHGKFDLSSSPDGKYAVAFDLTTKTMSGIDVRSGKSKPLALPPVALVDELDDHPDVAPMYGAAGFTKDNRALIYDRFDVWAIDPTGNKQPENLTKGTGRRRHLMFRLVAIDRDPDTGYYDLAKPLYLSAINDDNESSGIFELSGGSIKQLIYGEHAYPSVIKAKNAPNLAFAESTFTEYPDYWLTDTSFAKPVKVSDTNPQQAQYRWGSVELVSWMGNDGQTLKGLLYTPEGLDRTKKYPMITYYYERNAETLYNYMAPVPSASIINIPYFVSNGYVVFVPDIDYKIGYPGPSSYSAIVSGVQAMLNKGYIDPKRLGIQGQSWGGYQTAYLITQTNMFAAAGAGAPVGDMFSAYGGIRYGAGIVRQFQYEHSQSRIGGTPWEKPLQYLQNSPIFAVDRVNTPVLIMSNDKDGAVPHTQGIEFFVDLRRLNKPSWLLVYNDEDHNLTMRKNRKDLSIRLGQFFDHYLKGAPMPVWMSKGVPAIKKGKDYGFDLEKS